MSKLRSLILGAGFSLATIAMAHADSAVTGTWKLSIGANDAPCTLNLAADSTGNGGVATPSGDCSGDLANIAHWKSPGRGLQLLTVSNEVIAWLNPKADAFVGDRVSDGRKIALNR